MNKLCVFLSVLLVVCALGLVTSQNRARKVFAEVEQAQSQNKRAATLWSQLEVEQSALTKSSLIDGKARRSLAMQPVTNEKTLHLSMGEVAGRATRTASASRKP